MAFLADFFAVFLRADAAFPVFLVFVAFFAFFAFVAFLAALAFFLASFSSLAFRAFSAFSAVSASSAALRSASARAASSSAARFLARALARFMANSRRQACAAAVSFWATERSRKPWISSGSEPGSTYPSISRHPARVSSTGTAGMPNPNIATHASSYGPISISRRRRRSSVLGSSASPSSDTRLALP